MLERLALRVIAFSQLAVKGLIALVHLERECVCFFLSTLVLVKFYRLVTFFATFLSGNTFIQ
jgi:hypothetical protein